MVLLLGDCKLDQTLLPPTASRCDLLQSIRVRGRARQVRSSQAVALSTPISRPYVSGLSPSGQAGLSHVARRATLKEQPTA